MTVTVGIYLDGAGSPDYSGVLQWPASGSGEGQSPESATITVGIYLDGSGLFHSGLCAHRPNVNPPAPIPFSLFWETPANGAHTVDVKA